MLKHIIMKNKKTYLPKLKILIILICSFSIIVINCKKEDNEIDETEESEVVQKHPPAEYAGIWSSESDRAFHFEVNSDGYVDDIFVELFSAGGCNEYFSCHDAVRIKNDSFEATIKWITSNTITTKLYGTFLSTERVKCTYNSFSVSSFTCGGQPLSFSSSTFYATNKKMTVEITSPDENETISDDTVFIKIDIEAVYNIAKVEYYINDELLYTDNSWYFLNDFAWVTDEYDDGEISIKVIAYDENDNSASDEIIVNFSKLIKWKSLLYVFPWASPAISSDGTIYIPKKGSSDISYLYAINSDGTEKWNIDIEGEIITSPSIDSEGTIYISADDKLFAINPDGTKKWEFRTNDSYDHIHSTAAFGLDGTIYIGAFTYLFAVNSDGTKKWEFETDGAISASPAIGVDSIIYIGTMTNNFYAINPNGTEKWKFGTGGWVEASPSISSDGTIYIEASSHYLYAINPNGTKKWQFNTVEYGYLESSQAIGVDGTIYIGSNDNNLYAINPNGTMKWKFETGDRIEGTPAIDSDGTIYIGSSDHNFYAINPDGTMKWKFVSEYGVISSPAIDTDGTIYICSYEGYLYAIKGSAALANSHWPMFQHDALHSGRQE